MGKTTFCLSASQESIARARPVSSTLSAHPKPQHEWPLSLCSRSEACLAAYSKFSLPLWRVPFDMLCSAIVSLTVHYEPSSTTRRRTSKWISEHISQANAPAFLLDADAERFGLAQLIVLLAEANGIPRAHLIPKDVIDETHPLAIGTYRDAGSSPEVRKAIEGSDCLICIGTRFTDVASGFVTHRLDPKSIIDLQPFGLRAERILSMPSELKNCFRGFSPKTLEHTPFCQFVARGH